MKGYIYFLISFSLIYLFSCEKKNDPIDTPELGHDYYPLEMGKFWIYQVDSIVFDTTSVVTIDTTQSYMKEEVVDTSRDLSGNKLFHIDVYFRKDSLDSWQLNTNYFVRIEQTRLVKTENGYAFIRLIFPLKDNESWDGNAYINENATIIIKGEVIKAFINWRYYYSELNTADTIKNQIYKDVCTVLEADDENLIEKRYSTASYAKGVGQIYRLQKILDTQNTNTALPFEKRAQKGMILTQRLLQFN
ncbi:MAG: hypothetical protein M3Q56_00585 [Bacteroidota bacterium]|nr:hypothetical protein [Bacteroidota bacterium]